MAKKNHVPEEDRTVGSSRSYRIVVAGRLGRGFSSGLDGVAQRQVGPDTILEGAYIDQAHLHGLLDQLRGLGIEITSFATFATITTPRARRGGESGTVGSIS